MWPDWVSNPGPLTYESGALPTALCGPAWSMASCSQKVFTPYSCLLISNAFVVVSRVGCLGISGVVDATSC